MFFFFSLFVCSDCLPHGPRILMFSVGFSSIFSSLLSLIHLDMERNNLKTITPYLFSNNKQRMSINMAYNRLDFESKVLINSSWGNQSFSPFARAYNLRLLNLSHNEFKITFDDWWLNGHENLDISYNNITILWVSYQTYLAYS